MIKIAAAAVIIFGCSACGFLKARQYQDRVLLLSDFIRTVAVLGVEMEYRREALPDLFRRLEKNGSCAGSFFGEVRARYENEAGLSLSECWEGALNHVYGSCPMSDADLSVFREFGEQLGKCGIAGQEQMIRVTIVRLEELLAEARAEKDVKGKMYFSLGVAAGITIVILLI